MGNWSRYGRKDRLTQCVHTDTTLFFVEECIYAKMYEKACCQTWRIDSVASSIIPVPFMFDNSSLDNVLNFDKE